MIVKVHAGSQLLLRVNGEQTKTNASTLDALLADLDYGARRVATAVNGTFVPAGARPNHRLCEGDDVEIVAPQQGG